MAVKWTCPTCGTAVLGPKRAKANATCRWCLTCSAESPVLVARGALAVVKAREDKRRRIDEKVTKRARRAAARAQLEAERKAESAARRVWRVGFYENGVLARLYGNAKSEGMEHDWRIFEHLVLSKLTAAGREDPAWLAAIACEVAGADEARRAFTVAEEAYGARPSQPRARRASRKLYPALRSIFEIAGPLHRALSATATTATTTAADVRRMAEPLDAVRAAKTIGEALDALAERGGRIDALLLPEVPSLKEAIAGRPLSTPVWSELIVPCPAELISGCKDSVPRGTIISGRRARLTISADGDAYTDVTDAPGNAFDPPGPTITVARPADPPKA